MDREPSDTSYDAWLEGIQHENQYTECKECHGEGTVEDTESIADYSAPLGGEQRAVQVECEECQGRGELENEYYDYDQETLHDIYEQETQSLALEQ